MHSERSKKAMRFLAIIGIVAFLAGCADSHQLLRTGSTPVKLDRTKSIYISIPRDGKYGHINYQGSGINVSQIILIAFSKYSETGETGHQYQSFEKALAYAKRNKYGYLIFPTILEVKDFSYPS